MFLQIHRLPVIASGHSEFTLLIGETGERVVRRRRRFQAFDALILLQQLFGDRNGFVGAGQRARVSPRLEL